MIHTTIEINHAPELVRKVVSSYFQPTTANRSSCTWISFLTNRLTKNGTKAWWKKTNRCLVFAVGNKVHCEMLDLTFDAIITVSISPALHWPANNNLKSKTLLQCFNGKARPWWESLASIPFLLSRAKLLKVELRLCTRKSSREQWLSWCRAGWLAGACLASSIWRREWRTCDMILESPLLFCVCWHGNWIPREHQLSAKKGPKCYSPSESLNSVISPQRSAFYAFNYFMWFLFLPISCTELLSFCTAFTPYGHKYDSFGVQKNTLHFLVHIVEIEREIQTYSSWTRHLERVLMLSTMRGVV